MASAQTTSRSKMDVDRVGLRKHYLTLTKCQQPFVQLVVDWLKRPRKLLLIVSGGPGTGKSFVVKNTLDYIETLQLRMSFTARSAQAIGGRTIHSAVSLKFGNDSVCGQLEKKLADETDLLESIEQSREILSEFKCAFFPNIVVIDEVAMINGWLMYWLITYFMDRTDLPLLFICMGDPHQLNPVKSIHNLFSITFSENKYDVRHIRLSESKRFAPEYETIINDLRSFVDKSDETGMFTFLCRHFPVVEDIDRLSLMEADRAMAFKNDKVKKFNSFYVKNKVSGPEIQLDKDLVLKSGCLIFVTRNGCSSANNGTSLIFQSYDADQNVAMCKCPKTDKEIKVWRDNFTGRFPIDLGFAATVHKYQGDTIDEAKIVICFDGNRNLNLVYTALSRVREMKQIVAVQL